MELILGGLPLIMTRRFLKSFHQFGHLSIKLYFSNALMIFELPTEPSIITTQSEPSVITDHIRQIIELGSTIT